MIDHLARARACCPPGGRTGFCVSKLRRAALLRGMRDESRMGLSRMALRTIRMANLIGVVGVFEHGTDADGHVASKLWEWK